MLLSLHPFCSGFGKVPYLQMYVLLGRGLRSENCFNFLLLIWDYGNISCFVRPTREGEKRSHSDLEM